MDLNIKTVRNGYIAEHCGETYVFSTPEALTDWMERNYPNRSKVFRPVLSSVSINNQIPCIKFIREFYGLSLKAAKDKTDEAKASGSVTLGPLDEDTANRFKENIETNTSAEVYLEKQ